MGVIAYICTAAGWPRKLTTTHKSRVGAVDYHQQPRSFAPGNGRCTIG